MRMMAVDGHFDVYLTTIGGILGGELLSNSFQHGKGVPVPGLEAIAQGHGGKF